MAHEALSIEARQGSRVYAVAPDATIAALRARGFTVTLLDSPSRDFPVGYRTPDQINAAVTALVQPGVVLETLGTSSDGTAILGLRIGSGPRGIRYLGGHHGDELPAVEFVTDFAAALLAKRANDAAFAAQLSGLTLLIAPMVNPDGVAAVTRYNAHDIDLNRNYSYQFSHDEYQPGPFPFSENESRAVAYDNEYHRYASSLTYHTGADNIGYPWNYTTEAMVAEPALLAAAQEYATLVGGGFEALRGAQWYLSNGDTNDYSFGFFGGFDLTVEITGPTKTPDISELPGIEATQMPAAFDWLNHATEAALVHIMDSADGSALVASVSGGGVTTFSEPLSGIAQLQAPFGTLLTVSKSGYVSQTLSASTTQSEIQLVAQTLFAALPEPRIFAHDQAIEFTLAGDVKSVVATHAGSLDIVFACAAGTCSAAADARMGGMYDLAVTGSDARVHPLRNALLLQDIAATDTSTLSAATVSWFAAWGGAMTAAASAPASPSGVFGWVANGDLHTLTVATPANAIAPVSASKHRGCGAGGAPSLALLSAMGFYLARHGRRLTAEPRSKPTRQPAR